VTQQASLEQWREAIAELARYACGYSAGRRKDDPVYTAVTEGRDNKSSWRYYSSCADLGHWLAKRLGIREAWINRTDDGVHGPWESMKNVGKLGQAGAHVPVGYLPDAGDILILSNSPWPRGTDHHVCVYLGPDPDPKVQGHHLTANYGAAGLANTPIGGARIASRPLKVSLSQLVYGTKAICRVLTVPSLLLRRTEPADFSGPLPWTSGEVLDALEARP